MQEPMWQERSVCFVWVLFLLYVILIAFYIQNYICI